MTQTKSTYLALLAVLLSPMAANANPIVFDGGAPDQIQANDDTAWVQTEDFILTANTMITDVHFWTAETGIWDGTLDWFIFADNGGDPAGNALASGSGVNILKNVTGNVVTGFATEYEYSFDLDNPVTLLAGVTYWLGLHQSADFISDGIFWETTSSGFGMTGHESLGGTFDNWVDNGVQHAFYLTGVEVSVPEPGTLALLGIGLFGMGLARRKKV